MKAQIEKQAIEEMVAVMEKVPPVVASRGGTNGNIYLFADIAKALYSADYRKQSEGKWEKRIFIIFDSEKVGYRCSVCNTTWDTETNFCPYCGAHMKGYAE